MVQFLKKNKEICLLGIMQVLIFIVLAFGQWHKTSDMYVFAGVFLLQVISCIVLYFLFRKIFRNIEEEKKQSMLLKQQKYAEEHKKVKAQLDDQLEDIKEQVSHMLKNLQMNADKMSEKAFHEAVNEIISNSEQLYQVDFCDNKTIDAILYNKSLLAKSLHIPFDIQVQIPQQLNIAYVDLICVYANLLDNAIEANCQVDETQRMLKITSALKMNQLIVKVENAKPANLHIDKNSGKTTKTDTSEPHGLGLKILQRTAEKYHGDMLIQDKGHEVSVSVFMENVNVGTIS